MFLASPEAADLLGPERAAWVAPEVEVEVEVEVARVAPVNIAEAAIADLEAEWSDL